MVPYSTLLVFTFQPPFGFCVAEPYRFSVDGLFKSSLKLNATIVEFKPTEETVGSICISNKVQDRTRVKLSITGVPDSIVGLNVVEYDSILSGLSNDMTKERLLRYSTSNEHEAHPNIMTEERLKHHIPEMGRRTISEKDEEELIEREQQSFQVRYPVEKMFFGVISKHSLPRVEGDDIYTATNMGRLYGEEMRHSSSSHYNRRIEKSLNQYDVTVGENMDVVVTSMPKRHEGEEMKEHCKFGTPSWYEKMHSKLNEFSEEAFIFMQSGLTIITDFDALRIPTDMKGENLAKLFTRFHEQSMSFVEGKSLSVRDEARLLLEEYIAQSDLQMMPPPMMLEEQSRIGYHRSLFFDTRGMESTDTVEVVLPRTKPFTTWVATGFALNAKSGLSLAHPVHLPSTQGVYVLGCTPRHVRIDENVILTWSVNNYLGEDLSNVVLRIRASNDFDLIKPLAPYHIIKMKDQDYAFVIPTLRAFGVETDTMIWVPKRSGLLQIIIEVESEFGGDYEVLTVHVGESDIKHKQITARLFDLTSDKKTYGPIVEKISDSPALREVRLSVPGTGLDRFVHKHIMETNSLVGIDRAIVCLYRSVGVHRYLKETSQTESQLYKIAHDNMTKAYQNLQLFCDYDGSYSMFSDKGTHRSSLYLTSLAFGAMISPEMPFRDNVTLNRTLAWILSHQQKDGSFDDNGPCFHYRFCATEFRCESLTAIVVLALTRDVSSKCIRDRLFYGERSPIQRAYDYLESHVTDDKLHLLIRTLMEVAIIQHREVSPKLKKKILAGIPKKNLTVVDEDGSRYINITNSKMTFNDQLLLNAMALSIYDYDENWQTASDIARWIFNQIEIHPHYDKVLDAVLYNKAWFKVVHCFHTQLNSEKFNITVDVSADGGETRKFKIDSTNMDVTQNLRFALPVRKITYSVSGFGIATVVICEKFIETEQKVTEPILFQLDHELTPIPRLTELKAKTRMIYKPTKKDRQLARDNFNRIIVMEMRLPSGMRIDEHQLGTFLGHVPEVMHFTYEPCDHKLHIFINVPTTLFGKPICLEWCLEPLSTVRKWAPMEVRVFDYLQQERELVRLFPIQPQSSFLYIQLLMNLRNVNKK